MSVFEKIINGELPAKKLYEDDQCIVIADAHPQMPVHLLIIPRKKITMLSTIDAGDAPLLGHLLHVATKMAQQMDIGDAFRIVINNGENAGQTVFHLHLHLLGGKRFRENTLAG